MQISDDEMSPIADAQQDAAATIERLTRERDEARAEAARLREALRPFAKAGELFPVPRPANASAMSVYRPAAGAEYEITCEHLRAARAAYEAGPISPEPMPAPRPPQAPPPHDAGSAWA